MKTSMLNRLPDILTLARQRAREWWTCPVGARTGRRPPPLAMARFAVPSESGGQVALLCGDDGSVMSGLLSGQAQEGPLVGRVSMIWMGQSDEPMPDPADTPANPTQRRVRQLLELTTRLFLARELLVDRGNLVVMAQTDPDRCAQRLQEAVFGHCRVVTPRGGSRSGLGAHVTGRVALKWAPGASDADLLGNWVRSGSARHDRVLVLNAQPEVASGVAALDRRWVLAQRDAMVFHQLREHLVARHMEQAGRTMTHESLREWVPTRTPSVHPQH